MVNNFTNINKTNNHSISEHKKTTTYDLVLAWDKHNDVARLNLLIGFQPPFDNWISNSNTAVKWSM